MTTQRRSTLTFWFLVAILTAIAAISLYLPQFDLPQAPATAPQSQIPMWQLMLAGAGITLVLYGGLGWVGLMLWRRLKLPEIWEPTVTNRQRFVIPGIVGLLVGLLLIVGDLIFSNFNGIGRLPHPPFPTSFFVSISAAIGEEILFRLFFISFWSWLIGKVVLRGHYFTVVYWVVATAAAVAFAAAHLPSVMILYGVTDPTQFSPFLLVQILLLNSLISMFGAYYFKKYGFLAPVGIHFWADIVWHALWGLV